MNQSLASSEAPIVMVDGLRKTYASRNWLGRRKRIDALRGVSLQAHGGEVFGLLGPNGAGKTTLIKSLLGVIKPTGGSASLFGQPIGSIEARSRVGYLPESLRVDRHHTARTALSYYGRLSQMNGRQIAKRTDELLELVGLRGRDKESIRQFSKGMYQRLGLAQALMHDPDLLVLDEPTDGLDPVGRNEVRNVIDRLRDLGKTIFLNSHILQEVELVCTQVAIMNRGQILSHGSIGELVGQSSETTQIVFEVLPPSGGPKDRTDAECRQKLDAVFGRGSVETLEIESLDNGYRITASPPITSCGEDSGAPPIVSGAIRAYIDQAIDQLRAAGFSITKVAIDRASLEEIFMQLVQQAQPDSDNPMTGKPSSS